MRTPLRLLTFIAGCLAAVGIASAQTRPEIYDIWKVTLGMKAGEIPDEFIEHACGTHGGPPSIKLAGFTDFMKCKPEANGLREVYFRYDDEYEYWARANELELETQLFSGTRLFDYPVIMSLLFDEDGAVRGVRVITDPRVGDAERGRREFWTMANFVKIRFGPDNWNCRDLPKEEGESPAGSYFIKERCEKRLDGDLYLYERRYYHKKGQTFIDPHSGGINTEAYVSSTWFELLDGGIEPVPTATQQPARREG